MAWTMHVVFHIKNVGFGPFMLVFMGTLYEIAIMLFEVPTGVVADVRSRKLSATMGWFIVGIAFALEGIFPIPWVVIVAQLVLGFGETFVSGAHDAWIADEITHHDPGVDAGTAFLKGQQSSFIGRIIGSWTAVLVSPLGLNWVMIVAGLGFMVFSFFARAWMTEDGFKKSDEQRNYWATFREGWGVVRSTTILLLILAVSIFYGFASEGFDRLWNKTILDQFPMPKVWIYGEDFWWAVFATGGVLGGMFLNAQVRKRVNLESSRQIATVMFGMTIVLIGTIAGFALSKTFAFTLALFIVSRAIRRSLEPLLKTWTNLHAPSETRATVLSFSTQSHSIGEIAGGPVVGAIGQYRSAKIAVVTAAFLLLPTLPTLLAAKKRSDT